MSYVCGFLPRALDKVIPYTDVFLYDLKAYESNTHIFCTSQPNGIILENLKYLDGLGKRIEIRIPYVPGYNDGEIEAIAKFLLPLKNISKIRVLPYHSYSSSKYAALETKNTLPEKMPSADDIQRARDLINKITAIPCV